jgi:hypothetical protein
MHAAFADWYRSISVEPVLGQLQLRWRGLEALVEESVADDLLNLSRAFFGFPLSPEFAGRFRGFFKAVDEAFPQARNDAEIRTLAGAALVAHFEKEEWGDAAALALVVGAAAGQRKPSVPDILDLAREHVSERAAAIRARERLESTPPDTDAHLKALVAAANSNATTNLVEPLKAWMEALGQYFSETTYRENVLREESEILWWLFGGRSHDLACALTEIKEPAASLIIGKELGALIRIVPGPVGADAFLTAALKASGQTSSKEISLASSISACRRHGGSIWPRKTSCWAISRRSLTPFAKAWNIPGRP